MQGDFLRDKFTEIEILKGKLLTYPKECGNDIIQKLCMLCEEIEDALYQKKKKSGKTEKVKSVCPCKEKHEKHEKHEKSKDKHNNKSGGNNRDYQWSRELLKDSNDSVKSSRKKKD